jgi:2-amino-4-hydroxy-6-hydroxymethyldihydropteridine diphosphokinase
MSIIYLALGTNLGQREDNLRTVLRTISPTIEIIAVSRLYETAPAYITDQPNFLNMVIKGKTTLSPIALLTYLKLLEKETGRQKTFRYGPRKIDLDILFYDTLVINTTTLKIPHPRLSERGFVLHPLMDIAPDLVHPVLQKNIQQLTAELPADDGILAITLLQSHRSFEQPGSSP